MRVAVTFPGMAGLTLKNTAPHPPALRPAEVTDGGLGDDSCGAPCRRAPAVGIPALSAGALAGLSLLLAGLAVW